MADNEEEDETPKKCADCGELILGAGIQARGKEFHTEHFKCNACQQPIRGPFKIKDADQFCNECYDKKFSKTCKECSNKIVGKTIRAMDQDWHPGCFKCSKCSQTLQGNFHRQEGFDKPLCTKCYTEEKAVVCNICGKMVEGSIVSVQSNKYHPDCFKCSKCKLNIESTFKTDEKGNFFCDGCAKALISA